MRAQSVGPVIARLASSGAIATRSLSAAVTCGSHPTGESGTGPTSGPPGWGDIWGIVDPAMFDGRIIGAGELYDGEE